MEPTPDKYEILYTLSWQVLSYQFKVQGNKTRCRTDEANLMKWQNKLKAFLLAEKKERESKQQELFKTE